MGEKVKVLEQVNQLESLFEKYEITGRELAQVRALKEKLENQEMTVAVIGQFKRGKSTLVNAMLGEKVMPVGIVPVTAVVTSVKYGEKGARVHFDNGAVIDADFDEIEGYINEQENQDNHLGVSRVALTVPAEFLKNGITLVDTPGVGSVHQKNSDAAYAFVRESDAVIFMLSVDSPVNQIEIEFLEKTRAFASKFYFAVNKADIVDEDELADYLTYCRKLIARLMEMDVEDVALYPVSARRNTGLTALAEAVEQDCRTRAEDILTASVKLKLRDVVASALSQITLYRTALNLPMEEFEEKFAGLKAYIKQIQTEAADFAGQFEKNGAMLMAELGTVKNLLAARVSALFGMEFHYEMEEVELSGEGAAAGDGTGAAAGGMTKETFLAQVDETCRELLETLNTIFMYREENAYKVVRRINDLNRLVRSLVKMRSDLAGEQAAAQAGGEA